MRYFFFLVLVVCLNTSLEAQDTTVAAPQQALKPYRNPHKARILGSLFPGAGHFYAGEYLLGYGYYVATVGGTSSGVMVFMDRCAFSYLTATSCHPGPQWQHRALGIAMVGAGIWTWVSSARDASRAAERANARHEARKLLVKRNAPQ
jgi:hypothetical protein